MKKKHFHVDLVILFFLPYSFDTLDTNLVIFCLIVQHSKINKFKRGTKINYMCLHSCAGLCVCTKRERQLFLREWQQIEQTGTIFVQHFKYSFI